MSILIHLQDPAGGFWTEQAGGAGQWIRGGQNRGPGHGAATLHIKNIKVCHWIGKHVAFCSGMRWMGADLLKCIENR